MREGMIIFFAALTALVMVGLIGLAINGFVSRSTIVVECIDSEEVPSSIYEKGNVFYKTTRNSVTYVDRCYESLGMPFLIEYSCDKYGKINKETYYCRYGCGNGRCFPAP